MANPTYVFVTVPEGRETPFPPGEVNAPGAALLIAKPGKVYRVPYSSFTRRRVTAGDLTLTNQGGTAVDSPDKAAAGADVQLDDDGAVAVASTARRATDAVRAPDTDKPGKDR